MISSRAYAKVNLGLRIINKRDDGYHNIETVLATISLYDELTVAGNHAGIELSVSGIKLARDSKNIVFRAADLFLKQYKITKGVIIKLHKIIPVGAGLGGGSSDAATVLKLMRKLFKPELTDEDLNQLAQNLGMDVPFFITGGAACAWQRGDKLEYFELPTLKLILCYPGFPISTKWAYANVELNLTKAENWIKMVKNSLVTQDFAKIEKYLINDFEALVYRTYPELKVIKDKFAASGAKVSLLSGSGSCIYAIGEAASMDRMSQFLIDHKKQYFIVETVKTDI